MAISGADGTGPRPLAPVDAARPLTALGDTRQESIERLAKLDIGRQYQAQILSRFSDGSFAVRIADTAARLALPDGGKPGDRLALTLLATDPRPTFSLDAQEAAGAGAATGTAGTASAKLAQALAAAGTLAAADGASGLDAAAPATLSDTGRLAAALAGAAKGSAAGLVGSAPLAGAGAAAPQLASALQDTLSFSGLFYESHLQQWASGERPLGDLLREPQAKGSAAAANAGALAASAAGLGPQGDTPPQVLEARRNLLAYASAGSLPSAGSGSDAIGALDPAAAQMISLQLDTLEHQRVQWQGELWPGQQMAWEVRRGTDGRDRQTQAAPEQETWQSVVRFSLPGLGTISATLDLSGDRVRIQVRTDSDAATHALRANAPALAGALDVAGTTLENLQIRRASDASADAAVATSASTTASDGNP